jgi:hypothetical protein
MQNTILVVGPGTPASVVTTAFKDDRSHRNRGRNRRSTNTANDASSSSSSASSSSASSSASEMEGRSAPVVANEGDYEEDEHNVLDLSVDNEQNPNDMNNQDDGSSRDSNRRRRSAFGREDVAVNHDQEYEFLVGSDHDDEDEDDSDDNNNDNYSAEEHFFRASLRRDHPMNSQTRQPHYCPSMRHGGCINTAAWLDSGWILSTVNRNDPTSSPVPIHGTATEECPTQLVTSGDDYLVKFWDVRDAMGMTSPLAGGRATVCPFSASQSRNPHDLEDEWQAFYTSRRSSNINCTNPSNDYHLPGSVRLLSTAHTGHRGNVFHVTPLSGKPGVVATCGADGYLRLTDVETGESTVVISPEFEDELSRMLPIGLLSRRSIMNYSHHFINQNVGLLCSDRGLKRFDLRLSPREQSTERLVGGSDFRTCKACAILSPPYSSPTQEQSEEPTYVFGTKKDGLIALLW